MSNAVNQAFFEKLLKKIKGRPLAQGGSFEEHLKSITDATIPGTGTGFQPFNLDPVGKLLLPQRTPLQNMGAYSIKNGEQGDSYEYRAIVGKNTVKNAGAALSPTTVTPTSAATAGRSGLVDFQFASRKVFRQKIQPEFAVDWTLWRSSGTFNALGKTTTGSLITAKEIEERRAVWDCTTALGQLAVPTGTPSNSGGTLTDTDSPYTVAVIPLNGYGMWWWEGAGDPASTVEPTPVTTFGMGAGAIQGEGTARESAGISIASGSLGSIAVSVVPKKGAWGYLWLLKDTTTGIYHVSAVTATPNATLRTAGTILATLTTADGSLYDLQGYPMVNDGLFSQIVLAPDLAGEYFSLNGNGTPGAFTTTGSGSGILEFERIFAAIARKFYVSPTMYICSPATQATISNTALGSSAPAYRSVFDAMKAGGGNIFVGTEIAGVHNQFIPGSIVEPVIEPLMPDGKVIFYTKMVDYPDSGMEVNFQLHCTDHFLQDFFARTADVAPPGPWAIKSYATWALIFGKVCGVLDDIEPIAL